MGTMLQSIEVGQTITHTVQTPFKLSFPNSIFQILKVRIIVGGFTNVTDFLKINGIEDYEKVGLASLHLEGRALEWF